ncbi:MAG: double zinc ribbon domain-containing protein, partial [Patescibacteria group bacterium]
MKLYTSLENLKFKYNLPLIPSLVRKGKGWLLDLVFPRYCVGCQKELTLKQDSLICESCFDKITLNSGVQCHICGLRNAKGTCKKCRQKTPLKGLFAASQYENPILKEMIHLFKYQSVESLKKPLAELIINYLKKENLIDNLVNPENRHPTSDVRHRMLVLVPIPLTLKRKMSRGFNQSELLAEEIGKFLNCPVINLLKRKKFTSPQAEISD